MTGRLPYRPGIDGLRALAVAAVVLFHADVEGVRAGFLGVDVFFVISGYLITSLLLAEHAATGTIALGAFWLRRARRLLPGLVALLAGVVVAAVVIAPDGAGRLTGDLPAALAYVSNWWQALRGESYFESFGRPPLLRHLWSLAVEEQFYVMAPLVLGAALRRGWRRPALAFAALVLALASTLWMATRWSSVDASRAYFGTDTHAAPLLIGVALAVLWRPGRLATRIAPLARAVLDLVGVAALTGLVVLVASADEFGDDLYRGGFLLAAVLAALVVAVAAHPATRFAAVLGWRPLVWLGARSYALYLWHWPVIVLTRPGLDVDLHGGPLLALRLVVSLALADASFRLVEQPFRQGRVQRAYRSMRAANRRRIAGVVLGVGVAAWFAVAVTAVPRAEGDLLVASADKGTATTLAAWPTTIKTRPSTTTTTALATTATSAALVTTAPTSPPPTAAPVVTGPPAGRVLALGDSVMLASRSALEQASSGMVQVDAAVGRQVWDVVELLERYKRSGAFDQLSALVVHLGTNGPLTPRDLDRLAMAVAGVPRVVLLNVRVPRRWEETTNTTLRDGVGRFPGMVLADWYGASGGPGLLRDDGVHPTAPGMVTYARLVLDQLGGLTAPPGGPGPPPPLLPPTTNPPPPTTTAAPPTTTTIATTTTAPPATTTPTSTTATTEATTTSSTEPPPPPPPPPPP